LKQFKNLEKKYHTVGTVQKSRGKKYHTVETVQKSRKKNTTLLEQFKNTIENHRKSQNQ
jgi:hypothetical protein